MQHHFPTSFFAFFPLCLLALLTKLANKNLTIYLVKRKPEIPFSGNQLLYHTKLSYYNIIVISVVRFSPQWHCPDTLQCSQYTGRPKRQEKHCREIINMLLTVSVHVAIRNDDQSIYKHWGVFIDGRRKADKVIF